MIRSSCMEPRCIRALVFKRHCRSRNELILLMMPVTIVGTNFDSVKEYVKSIRSSVTIFNEHWHQGILTKWVQRHRKCIKLKGWDIHKHYKVFFANTCLQKTHECYDCKHKRRFDVKNRDSVPRVRSGTSV